MHTMLPCINPFCTQTFSPEELEGVSKLQCPKCGAVFEFVASPAASALPGDAANLPRQSPDKTSRVLTTPPPPTTKKPLPIATPSPDSFATLPIAQPLTAADVPLPANLASAQAKEGAANLNFNPTPATATPRRRRTSKRHGKRRPRRRFVGFVVGLLCVAAIAWGVWRFRLAPKPSLAEGNPARDAKIYNASLALSEGSWSRDKELQQRFHANIAMKSSERTNYLALFFRDYKSRLPSDAEMIDEAVSKLRAYFRDLEWELKPKTAQTKLAEQPALVLEFQGDDADQVTMNGECYLMASHGYGYWFFTWAPLSELEKQGEGLRAEWAESRQRFSLLDGRKGWKAKPIETAIVTGDKARYLLDYVKEVWFREAMQHEDPQLDLLLKGHEPDPERKPLAGKDAIVQVLVLPKQADLKAATTAALDFLKQRELKLFARTSWETIKDKNGDCDRDVKVGNEQGHSIKLHVRNTADLEHFWSIAVVNRPEGVVILFGDCLWDRRDHWDHEFTTLFKTFKVR